MKSIFFIFFVLFIAFSCNNREVTNNHNKAKIPLKDSAIYNASLARRLGADEYGMRRYVMAFLRAGKVKITDSTQKATLQMRHMENINKLAKAGKLIVAGPFLDNKEMRGIFIFNVESIEEAKKLTATDPAVQAGTLEMELHPWYGSAALIETTKMHKSIDKKANSF